MHLSRICFKREPDSRLGGTFRVVSLRLCGTLEKYLSRRDLTAGSMGVYGAVTLV